MFDPLLIDQACFFFVVSPILRLLVKVAWLCINGDGLGIPSNLVV